MSKKSSNKDNFLSGDSSRLFLNLELGCSSSCSYCYLPSEGMQLGGKLPLESSRTPAELLSQLQSDERFRPGRDGTILSIGCFSECWGPTTKARTAQLIQGLLAHDNWIQFATKREIHQSDLAMITRSPDWKGQVVAYISSASISQWNTLERGTTRPARRFKSFGACRDSGVHSCLYIKPVLPSVTIRDMDLYGEVMVRHDVDAVVGDLFVPGVASGEIASPISKFLHIAEHNDATRLRTGLATRGRVFENSTKHLLARSR